MRVLFTHSYFMRRDPKQWASGQPYPPLGTLYLAAVARKAGHKTAFFDTMFSISPEEITPKMKEFEPEVLVIADDVFNYLTKMCLTAMRDAALSMIRIAKKGGLKVIVTGSDAHDHYLLYHAAGADHIIFGEAEGTINELLRNMNMGIAGLASVKGISYRDKNEIVKNPGREVIREPDAIPLPAWELLDIRPYRDMWKRHHGYFSMNIVTTRGCPFKCNWCAKPVYGNRYSSRSPENVVSEMQLISHLFKPDHLWVCDDIFGLKPGWIQAFANELKRVKLMIPFRIQSRADLMSDESTVQALAEAGCTSCWLGAESGSQKILDAMDKGITLEQIEMATTLLKRYGISPSFFIQFGYPGETMEDIHLTIEMMKRLMPDDIGISVSYPLPGTVFYENVKKELGAKKNWSDSDDLALMFRSTYSPAFYKRLHRFVHKNFRKYQGMEHLKALFRNPVPGRYRSYRRAASYFYFLPASAMERRRLKKLEHE